MKYQFVLFPALTVFLVVILPGTQGDGAGRAFPVQSENYVIQQFQRINPRIQWDETNFLVDLSGLFANCKWIGKRDFVYTDRLTPDDVTIAGYTDDVAAQENHVDATHLAITEVIDSWMANPGSELYQQIQVAEFFGCSARPGCNERVSVGCLFSPQLLRTGIAQEGSGTSVINIGGHGDGDGGGPDCEMFEFDGRAFTPEQYRVAEGRIGINWDRSYFLEDLSGAAISCDMIGASRWNFTQVVNEAAFMGVKVTPLFGSSPNLGETEPAMIKVMDTMDGVLATQMGCSIMPDCMKADQMWVVVCCIFEF